MIYKLTEKQLRKIGIYDYDNALMSIKCDNSGAIVFLEDYTELKQITLAEAFAI